MTDYDFVTVDVFTDRRFGGNPLAVFPDARGLDGETMQRLAAEFNLSETTFVLPPDDPANDAHVRIFTPVSEMPFAGHPNVGTGYVLARRAGLTTSEFRFEEAAGLVRVTIARDDAGTVLGAEVAAPQPLSLGDEIDVETIAACCGLPPDRIAIGRHRPVPASMGAVFVIAELASDADLIDAAPVLAGFSTARQHHPGRFNLALYWVDPTRPGRVRMRMFAPLDGVPEDPATGSAAVALAGLLLAGTDQAEARYAIEQGAEMGRPDFLAATARRDAEGAITATVAGRCVPVLRGVATV